MSVAPAPETVANSRNIQAGLPKNMVPDPGWFDGDQSKFEDWWRGIRLFLKSNRVIETNDRITAILAHVKIVDGGLYFIFPFHFYFTLLYFFLLIFYF